MAKPASATSRRVANVRVVLSPDLLARLDEQVAESGVSRSQYLRGLVSKAIEDAEARDVESAPLVIPQRRRVHASK